MVMINTRVESIPNRRRPSVASGPRIKSYEVFHADLEHRQAMAWNQRYNFSFVLFDVQSVTAGQSQTKEVSRLLVNRIRSTDEAGWVGDDQLGVILPYTPTSGAARLAEDLQSRVGKNVASLNYTVYTFPSNPFPRSKRDATQFKSEYTAYGQIGTVAEGTFADMSRAVLTRINFEQPCGLSDISMPDNPAPGQERSLEECAMPIWKRIMDILGSALGLLVLSPLFLVVALAIKAVSRGPVFFKQERVGYRGEIFRLWKFRTYEVDADTNHHRQYMSNLIRAAQKGKGILSSPMTKLDKAPGIIPFGNLIRKTCIDELPQLINVLFGEMSLIGPRPSVIYEAEQYADWHRKRLSAVPGMTGLWQVSGKNRLSFNEMVRLDIRYARIKSLGLDTKILFKTSLVIVSQVIDLLLAGKNSFGAIEHEAAAAQA